MKRLVPVLALLAAPFAVAACASLLSYDDYRERVVDAGTTPPKETSPVEDTREAATPLDAPIVSVQPPARPAGSPVASGKGKSMWFAVKRYYLGSQNHAGVKSDNAWREWGYDLDKVCTSLEDSTKNIGTCRRVPEADQDTLLDGDGCRDNNFGQHIVALVRVYNDDFEKTANEGILLKGGDTWILRIDDVDGGDDAFAPGALYRAAAMKPVVPKWDGTDERNVSSDSVKDGKLEEPLATFKRAYIKDDTWVSGDREGFEVLLPISSDLALPMQLVGGVITLKLDAARTTGTLGVLAGAIPSVVLERLIKPIAISAGFCPGTPLYESLLKTVARFPDVYVEGKDLQDLDKQCNGVTLGMGFEVGVIKPVTKVVPPPPPEPGKCGDAG